MTSHSDPLRNRIQRHDVLVYLKNRQHMTIRRLEKITGEIDGLSWVKKNSDIGLITDDADRVYLPKRSRRAAASPLIRNPITHGLGALYAI